MGRKWQEPTRRGQFRCGFFSTGKATAAHIAASKRRPPPPLDRLLQGKYTGWKRHCTRVRARAGSRGLIARLLSGWARVLWGIYSLGGGLG
jgi:hypothetical protein